MGGKYTKGYGKKTLSPFYSAERGIQATQGVSWGKLTSARNSALIKASWKYTISVKARN